MRKWIHGEVLGFEINKLPQNCKKVEVKDNFYIVGESETHGNDHRVAVKEREIEFFERDGILYMVNKSSTDIYCPNDSRHDTQSIPPSIWEIRKSQEYDYIEMQARQVRD